MPSIKVTPAKGLHQVSGTSTIPNGSLSGHLQVVETLTAADGTRTLVAADSGKVFLVSLASGSQTFTLPALTAGFNCEIIVSVIAGSTARDLVITAPGDNMIVSCRDFTASGAAQRHLTNTFTTLTVDASAGELTPVGTRVRIFCDGTNYIALASADIQNAATIFVGS